MCYIRPTVVEPKKATCSRMQFLCDGVTLLSMMHLDQITFADNSLDNTRAHSMYHTGPSFNTGTENTIQVSKFKRIGFENKWRISMGVNP